MKKNVEISGALINGMLTAFRSAYALSDLNQFRFLEDFEDDHWYEFDIWYQLYQSIKKSNEHIDFSQILFKAGSDFIEGWFLHAGGHEIVKNHQDFIKLQTGSEGYEMVVRGGDRNSRGYLELIEFNEEDHFFHLKSRTLFPENFTKGVFYKGINLCNDLDYIEIDSTSKKDNGMYEVDLRVSYLPKNLSVDYNLLDGNFPLKEEADKDISFSSKDLYWIYRGVRDEFELNKKYNLQLQTLLKNRTDSLYNKTLELQNNLLLLEAKNAIIAKQKKELEQLTASQNKLFKVLGHDLKSPIASVNGLTGIMVARNGDLTKEEVSSYAGSIHLTSGKMLTLLHNLLDWARSQTGSLNINKEPTRINELIAENIAFFKATADSKKIAIVFDEDESLEAYCDRNTISTVIRNILSNALKFTPENGNIRIHVDRKGDLVEVNLADSGVGIEPNDMEKLFDSNTSFSKNGVNGEKGTGLGLTLCKEFVELNAGEIGVSSEVGKGTTFSFSVPVYLNKNVHNRTF